MPLPQAINLGIVLHVFFAGLFTYLWAHYRGLHPLACLVGGAAFMFGGPFFLHLYAGHLPNLCAMAWAPLLFLAIDGLFKKSIEGWILLGIFALSMQILAGHPQYVYFTVLVAGIYFLFNLKGKNEKPKILGGFFLIFLGAFFLTAIQLWTGFQAFSECGRNLPQDYHSASSFPFPPQNLLTLVLPDFFGNLTSSHYWSQWFLWEVSLFIGITTFLFAVLGVVSTDFEKRKWVFAAAVTAFLFSLGSFTPFYQLFFDYLPWFKGFRGVCKFDYLTGLFLALLGAIGFDHLLKNKIPPNWIVFLTVFVGFVFAGMEVLILDSLRSGTEGFWAKWFTSLHWLKKSLVEMEQAPRQQLIFSAGLQSAASLFWGSVVCVFLSVFFCFQKTLPVLIFPMAGLAVLELFIFARANRPTFETSLLQNKYDQIRKVYENDPGEYRVYGTGSASLVTGGYDLWEDEPMVLGRYGRFVCYSQGLQENQLFSVLPIYRKFGRIFGMLRLKYLVSADREPVQVYPTPFKLLPRMKLINEWEARPDYKKILEGLFDPKFDPSRKVFLETPPDPLPAPGKIEGNLEWKDLSTDEIEIKADLSKPALLLVTDNYSRGWRVKPLSETAQASFKVLPGNYFLRVIPLSTGRHHFILEYLPTVFVVGKWVSILSCLIYAGILTVYFRGKTPQTP